MVQKAGHEVTGLDIGLYEGCDFGPPPEPVREIRADLRDVDGSLLKGFDAVIHLAALSNDPFGDFDAELTYDINHRATVRLARLAREAGAGGSCSRRRAATTAPPVTTCWTRPHRSTRSRRTASPRCAPKATCSTWLRTIHAGAAAQCHGVRGLAAASL